MYKLALQLLINPKKGFSNIFTYSVSNKRLYFTILVPLTFLASFVSIIRLNLVGIKYNNIVYKIPINTTIIYALIELILLLAATYLSIIMINSLIKSFKFLYPLHYIYKLIIFSIIPAYLGEIFFLHPKSGSLSIIFQLYSFYLIYIGLQNYYKEMRDKTTTIFLLIVLILMFIFTIVFGILNSIIVNVLKG
ncbi:MAG TPA: hypothetical protein PL041_06360 [Melioribacteraceae bacterium]|nr:hypothetical protein [Melioribacteraceae bacterium]